MYRVAVFPFAVLLCLLPTAAFAQYPGFVEDFSTTEYRDAGFTTADWDTVAGHLTLQPFTPSERGSTSVPGTPIAISVLDGYAFVGTETAGLQVVDITDGTSPSVVADVSGTSRVEAVDLDGELGVMASGAAAMYVFTSTDPTVNASAGASTLSGETHDIDIESGRVYVAAGSAGLQIVGEVSGLLGSFPTSGTSWSVEVRGDVAFVAQGSAGIQLVDVTDPAAPVLIRTLAGTAGTIDLDVEGSVVHAVTSSGTVLVVEDVYGSPQLATLPLGGVAHDIDVAGERAFVAAGAAGVHVVDVRDPGAPAFLRSLAATDARGVAAEGATLYLADGGGALRVVEWASAGAPELHGLSSAFLSASDGVLDGDVLWIAAESQGVIAFDLSDPLAPTVVSSTPVSSFARGIDVAGEYAFVCDLNAGLLVLDVSDPAGPVPVTTLGGLPAATAIDVRGDRAYVTGKFGPGEPRLYVIDIEDPTAPALLSTWTANNQFVSYVDVVAARDVAYIAAEGLGVVVLDLGDELAPTELAQLPASFGSVGHLALERFHLYASESGLGLRVYDTRSLALAGEVQTFTTLQDLVVRDRQVYVTSDSGTLHFDARDPSSIQYSGSGYLSVEPCDVLVLSGGTIAGVGGDVATARLLSDLHDVEATRGRSLPVDGAETAIVAVRVNVQGAGRFGFWLVTDLGLETVSSSGNFAFLAQPTDDLAWRAGLYPYGDTAPILDEIALEWRVATPEILSIEDVPDDQGGWVRLSILGAGYDAPSSPEPILGYNLMRRVDDMAPVVAERGVPVDVASEARLADGTAVRMPDTGLVRVDDRLFVAPSPSATPGARAVPTGTWEVVGSFFATGSEEYLALVPTSTSPSVFYVSAHSASGQVYESLPDSASSLDDIPPGAPTGLIVDYGSGGNSLAWDPAPEPDFQFHRVYRSLDPDFEPAPSSLVAETADTAWTDPVADPWRWTYKVTAVDHSDNESTAAIARTVTSAIPNRRLELHPPRPNPFNPRTTLVYSIPRDGTRIELAIHDAAGRRIRTLLSGTVPAGTHEAVWDGTDDRGARVSSGVYFARLRSGSIERRVKMVLVK